MFDGLNSLELNEANPKKKILSCSDFEKDILSNKSKRKRISTVDLSEDEIVDEDDIYEDDVFPITLEANSIKKPKLVSKDQNENTIQNSIPEKKSFQTEKTDESKDENTEIP